MQHSQKDALTDVAQNLPAMAGGNNDTQAGTVVSGDGTRVTLGQEAGRPTPFPSAQTGMNTGKKG